MTIRNLDAFTEGLWDFGPLNQCFTHGIRMGDVDGLVERGGNYLALETKGPTSQIPLGQRRSLHGLTAHHGFTVVRAWGEPNKPQRLQISYRGKRGTVIYEDRHNACMDMLIERVAAWYRWADANPKA